MGFRGFGLRGFRVSGELLRGLSKGSCMWATEENHPDIGIQDLESSPNPKA